uniref:MBL fold metallo-hydrolase n=1 Tax=Actinomadura sp. CA-154981 TaxID=3240037 RepID=UPI003F491ED5
MKVHHLNCGTMNVPGRCLVCHVLLAETEGGLVLVDTGIGLRDIAEPALRLGAFRRVIRPVLDPEETAARQIERLGFRRTDVRHVILTHFDLDHIGGLADFPGAKVHTTAEEARGALRSPSAFEKRRYRKAQWAHGPDIVEHRVGGERWRGFAAAKELDEIAPGIVLLALPGHTRGHACVAVNTGDRWVLHAGDAFYDYRTLESPKSVPRFFRVQESLLAHNRAQVRENHARLIELHQRAEPDLDIICAHDRELYERMRA